MKKLTKCQVELVSGGVNYMCACVDFDYKCDLRGISDAACYAECCVSANSSGYWLSKPIARKLSFDGPANEENDPNIGHHECFKSNEPSAEPSAGKLPFFIGFGGSL